LPIAYCPLHIAHLPHRLLPFALPPLSFPPYLLFLSKFTPLSHSKERNEKICLNCGAVLYGRYCHECSQENIEPKQSAWHLITHFFYDITHFDGKFFTTLKDLLIRPGFLSKEYISGKRASYLHPIRMYVFTSAIFFIIFFSLFDLKNLKLDNRVKLNGKSMEQAKKAALANAKTKGDSISVEQVFSRMGNIQRPLIFDDSSKQNETEAMSVGFGEHQYKTIEEYDSIQKALPEPTKDGWFKRMIMRKQIDLNVRYKGKRNELLYEWITVFLHNFPKMLFISLPIFALLLQLLYIRRRKKFYYADHGIFAIHLYVYSFIALLFIFGIRYIINMTGWGWLWLLNTAIIIYSMYYFYKSMRNFYEQGGIKTFLKYIILYALSFTIIIILFIIFFLFSILEI